MLACQVKILYTFITRLRVSTINYKHLWHYVALMPLSFILGHARRIQMASQQVTPPPADRLTKNTMQHIVSHYDISRYDILPNNPDWGNCEAIESRGKFSRAILF